MVNVTINNIPIAVKEGTTIMEAAEKAGIYIPHLCYLKEINEIGACRLCCVEVEGESHLVPACDNIVSEGMKITTNSKRVRAACRANLHLIMSEHHADCTHCARNLNCQLQKLASDFDILRSRYPDDLGLTVYEKWNPHFPLIRDSSKCIKCMRCIQVCDKVQSMKVWDLVGTGSRTRIGVARNFSIEQSDCTLCGQCIVHCPVGALREHDEISKLIFAIEKPDLVTVVQIAPAVRTAWGEAFGLSEKEATVNRLAACLKKIGVDYVFDSCFSADLTIMEEGSEFLERKKKGDLDEFPMFTSCCPGWVSFVKSQFPSLVPYLSTAKSPQQMFGAVSKAYFAKKIGVPTSKVYCISIMPCLAKKGEAELPSMVNHSGIRDVDLVLTTRELIKLLKSEHVFPKNVDEIPFDSVLNQYSGAGVIFGTTGGVMEAALRTASFVVTGKNPEPNAFDVLHTAKITKEKPWRSTTVSLPMGDINIAVVSGLANARKLCEAIIHKEVKYDFVEVMACPGGCVNGGGQPINCDDVNKTDARAKILHKLDEKMPIRYSHENEDVKKLYEDFLGAPLGRKSEEILHVDHLR
ncbi:MAG: hydrogenase [Treponema bryantii]|nr:hydrogenase [Treponema bryantii]